MERWFRTGAGPGTIFPQPSPQGGDGCGLLVVGAVVVLVLVVLLVLGSCARAADGAASGDQLPRKCDGETPQRDCCTIFNRAAAWKGRHAGDEAARRAVEPRSYAHSGWPSGPLYICGTQEEQWTTQSQTR